MKLIEALKQIKDLARKADDLKAKVRENCARHLSHYSLKESTISVLFVDNTNKCKLYVKI